MNNLIFHSDKPSTKLSRDFIADKINEYLSKGKVIQKVKAIKVGKCDPRQNSSADDFDDLLTLTDDASGVIDSIVKLPKNYY